ncbi:MAG: hypothetical protein LBI54_09105 [Lachnospiraceae bacterium]|nr:hypothetical protein [Lachnospiraceae bacterium]
MTEEQVTKAVLAALIKSDWIIVTYDFPQSGTGKMLHPNKNAYEKNKGGIIPDIVAAKSGICLFFENKDRVVVSDFDKISLLINDNQYSDAISALLNEYCIHEIFYGIAFPSAQWNEQAELNALLVDFIAGITVDKQMEFLYNPHGLRI